MSVDLGIVAFKLDCSQCSEEKKKLEETHIGKQKLGWIQCELFSISILILLMSAEFQPFNNSLSSIFLVGSY